MANRAELLLAEAFLAYREREDPEGQAIAKVLEALAVADRTKDTKALHQAGKWADRAMSARRLKVEDLSTGETWDTPVAVALSRHNAAELMAADVRRRLDRGETANAIVWWMVVHLWMNGSDFGLPRPDDPWLLQHHILKRIDDENDECRFVIVALRAWGMSQKVAKNLYSYSDKRTMRDASKPPKSSKG